MWITERQTPYINQYYRFDFEKAFRRYILNTPVWMFAAINPSRIKRTEKDDYYELINIIGLLVCLYVLTFGRNLQSNSSVELHPKIRLKYSNISEYDNTYIVHIS